MKLNQKMKTTMSLAAAIAGLSLSANAATVLWQTPVTASGDGAADVHNSTSTLEYAYQYGSLSGALTIGGVTFADVADTSSASTSFRSAVAANQQGNIGVIPGTTGNYETFLRQNVAAGASSNPWTLHGLTSGNDYLLQLWVADVRFGSTQTQTFTSGGNTTDPIFIKTGQYVIGTFTADATTQEVTMNGNIMNGMQLRHIPVPEPSTTALLGLGGLALILRRRK